MSITAAACSSCVLGYTSTALLSFTYHTVETITVSVIPHITVYTSGSSTSRTTNYVTITETATDIVGGGSNRNASKTFSQDDKLTWTVGDATLTYPTTYVQYLGFAGAAVSSDDQCATGADATPLTLPSSTDAAAFIYPLTAADSGATSLPGPLLQYLQDQAPFAAQFSGQALAGCAGLQYTPPATTPSVTSSVTSSSNSISSVSSPSVVPSLASTPTSWSNYTTTRSTKVSTDRVHTQHPGQPHPSSSTYYYLPSSAAEISSEAAPSSATPQPITTTATAPSINTHSTAYSITSVTAQSGYVTFLPAPSDNQHTTGGGGGKPTTTKHHNGGSPTGGHDHTGGDSVATALPEHTPTGHHTGGGKITSAGHNQTPGKPHKVFTVGSKPVTAKPHGPVTIGSHTLHRGQTLTLGHGASATTVALHGHGKHESLVVNGKPQKGHLEGGPITRSHALVSSAVITSGGHKITVIHSSGSVILLDGSSKTTVAPGSKVTFEGQTIRVPSHGQGGGVTINGDHVPLTGVLSSQAVITAGGDTLTAVDSGSSVIIKEGSKTITLKDGGSTKFEGHTISVGPSGSAVVVDGKTATLSAAPTPEAIITAGGHTITALDMSGSVILEDGHSTTMVKDGRHVVFEGQTFKVPPHGTAVVVNGKTVQFTTSTSATTTGVGDYVNSGLGGGSSASATRSVQPAGTNAAVSAGLTAVGVRWSALLAALGLLVVV